MLSSPQAAQSKNPRASQTTHLSANDEQNEVTDHDRQGNADREAWRASAIFILIHTSLQRGVHGSTILVANRFNGNYLTHLIKLIAYCAEGAGCNSPAQRAGWAKQEQVSAESAQCDRPCADSALDESGALNMHRPRFQRSLITYALRPGPLAQAFTSSALSALRTDIPLE